MNKVMLGLVLAVGMSLSVQAAEMNHDAAHPQTMDHSKMDHDKMDHSKMAEIPRSETADPQTISVMPPSGTAREGGYDGRYIMEPTSAGGAQKVRCAQASRGLIMLDNAEWTRCGGKPAGAAEALLPAGTRTPRESGHAGHNM
jgi:uncharacterized protein involved in copper resistance